MSGTSRPIDLQKLRKQLVAFGKKRGQVTRAELNELLPPELSGPEDISTWVKSLQAEGIDVVDKATDRPGSKAAGTSLRRPNARGSGEDEAEGTETVVSHDPVRMYLRRMGSVSLLTREGEVEIAKRIEAGNRDVLEILLNSPIAVPFLDDTIDRVRRGQLRIKDVVNIGNPNDDADRAESTPGQEVALEQLYQQHDAIRALVGQLEELAAQPVEEGEDRQAKAKALRAEVTRGIVEMNLHPKRIDAMIDEFSQIVERLRRAID